MSAAQWSGVKFSLSNAYRFRHIVEIIYLEWECIVLGMCREDKSNLVFNPLSRDLYEFLDVKDFYTQFGTALVMADDQHQADEIERQLQKPEVVRDLIYMTSREENDVPCNAFKSQPKKATPTAKGKFKSAAKQVATMLASGGEEEIPQTILDKRFRLPNMKKQMNHMVEAVSKVALMTQRSQQEKFGFDYDSHSEEDEFFTDCSSDEEDEEEEGYIGFAKKQSETDPQVKGIGSRTGRHEDIEQRTSKHEEIENEGAKKDEASDNSESDESDDYDDDDFPHSGGIAAMLLQQQVFKPGSPSAIIKDASQLSNHIVLISGENNLMMFVQELRRPAIVGESYHPVLVVHHERPSDWSKIASTYNDIYLMIGNSSKPSMLKKMNFNSAFSVSLMGNRDTLHKVDGLTVNTGTLFTYLKAETFVPNSCFLTVELTSSNNMSVLNATIMRRHREYMERQRGRPRGDTLVNNQYSAGSTLLNTSKIDHKHIVHSPSPNR